MILIETGELLFESLEGYYLSLLEYNWVSDSALFFVFFDNRTLPMDINSECIVNLPVCDCTDPCQFFLFYLFIYFNCLLLFLKSSPLKPYETEDVLFLGWLGMVFRSDQTSNMLEQKDTPRLERVVKSENFRSESQTDACIFYLGTKKKRKSSKNNPLRNLRRVDINL